MGYFTSLDMVPFKYLFHCPRAVDISFDPAQVETAVFDKCSNGAQLCHYYVKFPRTENEMLKIVSRHLKLFCWLIQPHI